MYSDICLFVRLFHKVGVVFPILLFFVFVNPLFETISVVSAEELQSKKLESNEKSTKLDIDKSNTEDSNPEEQLRNRLEAVGQQAIKETFDNMRQLIVESGKGLVSDSKGLTSDDILKIANIGEDVIGQVEGRKKAIKAMILETAKNIEENRKVVITLDETGMLSSQTAEKAKKLSKAFEENRISLNSLVLAIQATFSLSKDLHNKAVQESDPAKKYNLYLDYTAFVYEMSSIVIDTIENFTLGGVENIKELYDERLKSVNQLKQRIQKRTDSYKSQLQNNEITEERYQSVTKQYFEWLDALGTSLKGWDIVFSVIDKQQKWAGNLQKQVEEFKKKKDDADIQLDILVEIGIAKAMLNHLDGLEKFANLELPKLLLLDEEIARQLLGIDVPKKSSNIPALSIIKNNQ